jgi:type II secretory pathway pseudopilin PulG
MRHVTPTSRISFGRLARQRARERGVGSLILVSLLMLSILMAMAISNWVSVQRRGDVQMRVAMKETMLAQSAIQETRLRLFMGTISSNCNGVPQLSQYYVNGSTVSVRVDCVPFP